MNNKKRIAIIIFLLILIPFFSVQSKKQDIWRDRSDEIKMRASNFNQNIISFLSSRGNSWLIGNQNNLYYINKQETINLTDELKNNKLQNIRKITTDGETWLILGDTSIWNKSPDLLYRFNGVQWYDVSFLLKEIDFDSLQDFKGTRGTWYFISKNTVFVWNETSHDIQKINFPDYIKKHINYSTRIKFYKVNKGWILTLEKKNELNTLIRQHDCYDKYFYYLYNEKFIDITKDFYNIDNNSIIGTNGQEILIFGLAFSSSKEYPKFYALVSNGEQTKNITKKIKYKFNLKAPLTQMPFFNQGKIIWTGSDWVILDGMKNFFWLNSKTWQIKFKKTRDTFLNAGYGGLNSILLSGFRSNDFIKPLLVEVDFND